MNVDVQGKWEELRTAMRELEVLGGISGLMHWDQQTHMPAKGGALRGEQHAVLSRIHHDKFTAPRIGELLAELSQAELDPIKAAGVRNLHHAWQREARVSGDLVARLAQAEATGFEGWMAAREAKDTSKFLPHLRYLVELLQEKTAAIDAASHPYDVLLDSYDPGTSVASLRSMFGRLVPELRALVDAVRELPQPEPLGGPFPVDAQVALNRTVAATLGYDFHGGRVDVSTHPFTVGIGRGDVRITTRYHEDDLLSGLGATIHETGHALYEQGLRADQPGWGVASPASVGVHESQSRFWENAIGRSRAFCGWLAPQLQEAFPAFSLDAAGLYRACNRIEPSFIRVEADEVTYNLHVAIRFEIEVGLLEGSLPVDDVEAVWNDRYRSYLGVEVSDPVRGVLQDVHWASGAFGYFPSYTLGNLYAAALLGRLEAELPELWSGVERGEVAPVLGWLRENVHQHGSVRRGEGAIRHVVGDVDLVDGLVRYLWGRHGALYGVSRS